MKLSELASAIHTHLKRIEADPKLNVPTAGRDSRFYRAHAYSAGSRVGIIYVSYQGETCLKKADAERYLAWLNAGNVGTHHQAIAITAPHDGTGAIE